MTQLRCGDKFLNLSRPVIMGVLNTTPDSFSDGGNSYKNDQLDITVAVERARAMVEAGATIIDVGGESTRPGAATVSTEQELQRVVPVVEAIKKSLDTVVSVDTSSPVVIREAAAAGAGLINDVRALQKEGAIEAAAKTGLPVCLMHMQGQPDTMQQSPAYSDVVTEVKDFLAQRLLACEAAGIPRDKILLDPGFGFGKSLDHNYELLRRLSEFDIFGLPLLVGMSRKSMIGQLLNRDVSERLAGSLALALLAVQRGAKIIRVHDVAATQDVLQILAKVEDNSHP